MRAPRRTQRNFLLPTANCPFCGAPVRFRGTASSVATCEFCRSTLVKQGTQHGPSASSPTSRPHPEIRDTVRTLDVLANGHAMARPGLGLVWSSARRRVERRAARVHFAHSDASGFSLFEEAQYRGVAAAERVLASPQGAHRHGAVTRRYVDPATCDPPIPCPSCAQAMTKRALPNHDAGRVCLDLCYPCHAIWFDRNESVQLAPGAVIELFRDIHAREDEPRRALPERFGCPRCRAPLALTHDLTKAGRFSYWRCPAEHGRLTPFFQFLREKRFVRSLTPAELGRVRAELKIVRCSSCGAPIDLERDTACGFCKAPLAILDADAVRKALREWSEVDKRRPMPTRATIAQAVFDMRAAESRAHRDARRWSRGATAPDAAATGTDLFDLAVAGLAELLNAVDVF